MCVGLRRSEAGFFSSASSVGSPSRHRQAQKPARHHKMAVPSKHVRQGICGVCPSACADQGRALFGPLSVDPPDTARHNTCETAHQ
jgi:hypothetical protein